jgi:glycosyltransferase involved in cell wall biosynthesis
MMKKILLVTNSFSPINSPATNRYLSFAKYLTEFECEVIVVTPLWTQSSRDFLEEKSGFVTNSSLLISTEPTKYRIERVPFIGREVLGEKIFGKLLAKITFSYSNYILGTLKSEMFQKVCDICKNEPIDIIISGGVPQYLSEVSSKASSIYDIPWIADYRDVIGQTPIQPSSFIGNIRKSLSRSLHVKKNNAVSKSAVARLTVSEGLAGILYERNNSPVHIIMNGFDSGDFEPCASDIREDKFTIIYGGTIYPSQFPEIFIKGLELLLGNEPNIASKITVKFYGQSASYIKKYVSEFKFPTVLEYPGLVDRKSLLRSINSSDIILFLSTQAKGIATSKIFESIASQKPILSIPGDNDITDELIKNSNAGLIAETPEQVCECLKGWISEWELNGTVSSNTDLKYINQFSRESQAKKLAEVLNDICKTHKN